MTSPRPFLLTLLAALAVLTPNAGAQTQEIQDALDAVLAESKPAPRDGDKSEAKPLRVPSQDHVDFVFVASDRPVLLRLHLRNDGRPYSAAWDGYMQKLYTYLDKNGDGVLDQSEVERAPDIQFLQFQLQGSIGIPYQGSKGQMPRFDTNKDGKVSLAEFKQFYRGGNLTPLQLNFNSNRGSNDAVTNTIYQRLDTNKDGKLSAKELARAETALRRFDLDENEILTPPELTPGGEDNNGVFAPAAYGGMGGPTTDLGFLEITPATLDAKVRQVLTHYDRDKNGTLSRAESGLDKALFDTLDANHDGQLDLKEFAGFFRREADLEMIVRLGKLQAKEGAVVAFLREVGVSALQGIRVEVFNANKRAMPLAGRVQRADASGVTFSLGDAHIGLAVSDQQFRQFPSQFFEQQFRQADAGKKGVVDRKQAMSSVFLDQIFVLADHNADGKLTQKELKAYLDMQSEGSGARLQLTLTDEGRSLFDLLDEDADNRLSIRELRTAWTRLKPLIKGDGGLSRQDIPRRLDVSAGSLQRRVRVPVRRGNGPTFATRMTGPPLWFQKMDRNQDGDISPREFIGDDEAFRKLDADGDELISREEARQFEERLKKEKDRKR